jgi:tRNA-uridine 2-sulfurtransferase
MKSKILTGLSGGVDSSLSASLLVDQGFEVSGAYMKNWSTSLPGFDCPWKEDYQDAKRTAIQLGIDFQMLDFETSYKQKVVDYMIDEFKIGRTPNPDIMCNQEIKFKLFFDAAADQGFDKIATGHYAKTENGRLFKAKDQTKDQTYFLYRVSEEALRRTIFPLADLNKSEVREIAKQKGLVSAARKESMGICFVGQVDIRDFISQYIETQPGKIVDQHGLALGEHQGAILYTIGQRHGLGLSGAKPYYVTGKNLEKNEVYVTSDIQSKDLWSQQISVTSLHAINNDLDAWAGLQDLEVRTRHLGELIAVSSLSSESEDSTMISLTKEVKVVAPGQSVVIYQGERVLGGGFAN